MAVSPNMLNPLIELLIFIFGMCIGSFLNVCIYRLPNSKSILEPMRSVCPGCNTQIAFYDNIPLLSYLWLKGRCRQCNMSIAFRYPLVEIISGFFALCVFIRFGLTLEGLIYFAFIATLLVITFIDIDHRIIPDVISLPGIPLGVLAALALPSMTFKSSVLGLLVGGGSLLLVAWVYSLITRKEGMGGGDIKILAMIGTIIGWKGVIFTIFAASFIGTLAGAVIILRTRKNLKLAIPFGPFLSLATVIYIFFGQRLISWYLGLVV